MQRIFFVCLMAFILTCFFANVHAEITTSKVAFEKLFSDWAYAFNHKKYPEVCNLFAKNIIFDYKDSPSKNYAQMCDGFEQVFKEKDKTYHYDFKISNVYRANDLAVVKITWYLTIYKNAKAMSFTQEESLDILQQQKNSTWQIINFLAYGVISDKQAQKKG